MKLFYSAYLLLCLLPFKGLTLSCIQCSSLRNPDCLDGFGEVQKCNKTQRFCVSYTGYFKEGISQVLFRGCSLIDMSTFCRFHFERIDANRYEKLLACYDTCNTDLCNVHKMDYTENKSSVVYCNCSLTTAVFVFLFSTLNASFYIRFDTH